MRPTPSLLLVPLLLLTACEAEPTVEPTRFLGQDPAVPAAVGEARAGVIREGAAGEAALFAGIGAEGQAGDIKIYNPRVQFIVQDAGRRHGWVDVGGTVVDADLVRPAGEPGRDALDDAFCGFGLSRLYDATSVEVLADGSEGGAAVVRTIGHDVQWDFFARGLEAEDLLAGDQHLAIVRDYELDPGSDSLRVVTTFTNEGTEAVSIKPVEGFMTSKEDFATWSSGRGLVEPGGGDLAAAGYYGLRNEGVFSVWSEAPISVFPGAALVAVASISVFDQGQLELAPGATETRVVHYTVAPDVATAEASRRDALGLAQGAVTGRVVDSESGAPVAGARVHFVADEEFAGYVVTDTDGRFTTRLPPGDWQAWVTARHPRDRVDLPAGPGRYGPLAASSLNEAHLAAVAGEQSALEIPFAGGRWTPAAHEVTVVADGTTDLAIEMPAAGELRLTITDASGAPLSGIARIQHAGSTPPESPLPDELREPLGLPGRSLHVGWLWTAGGDARVPVPPGDYLVEVGHSVRHERSEPLAVSVPAGATGELSVVLPEVLPRDGWFSVDAHLHAAPSMDGETAMEDRLIACAGSGLDVPVTTDHDRFADYRPLATALGLDDLMEVMPGTEVTTIIRGHFNLFPVEVGPRTERNRGALVWWDRDPTTTDELVARTRAVGTSSSLLQVNHGRLTLGMMDSAGYDAQAGEPGRASQWSWDFDQTEIITAGEIEDWRENRDDWFSFLGLGHFTVPIGASDSHDQHRACGLGRTDVFIGADTASPSDLTSGAVRDAIAAGHVVVGSGVTLRATLDVGQGPELPGEILSGAGGQLRVVVSGPTWVQPATLNVWQNGEVVHTEELPPNDGGGPLLDAVLEIEADADSWWAVEVDGGEPLGHAWGGEPPYAITNAFFLDVDGDGWEPPGP